MNSLRPMIIKAIEKLCDFCQVSGALWPNGPTGKQYLDGLVRVDQGGNNRGSWVNGLTSFTATLEFLIGLDWKVADDVPENARRAGCEYYQAQMVFGSGFVGVISVADARAMDLKVEAVGGKHGTEFHAPSCGYCQQTTTVTLTAAVDS